MLERVPCCIPILSLSESLIAATDLGIRVDGQPGVQAIDSEDLCASELCRCPVSIRLE